MLPPSPLVKWYVVSEMAKRRQWFVTVQKLFCGVNAQKISSQNLHCLVCSPPQILHRSILEFRF